MRSCEAWICTRVAAAGRDRHGFKGRLRASAPALPTALPIVGGSSAEVSSPEWSMWLGR
jgi:hypothetical protein